MTWRTGQSLTRSTPPVGCGLVPIGVAVVLTLGVVTLVGARVGATESGGGSSPRSEPVQAAAGADAEAGANENASTSLRDPGDFPSVDELCRRAVEAAMADPDRARSFVTRARLGGWLPETTFRVYRRAARTEGVTFDDPVTGVAVPVDIKAIDDVRYEWRATWDLSRIVFSPDEIAAHLEALRMGDVRREIQLLVIRLYFERKRLLVEGVGAPPAKALSTTPMPEATGGTAETAVASGSGQERRLRILELEAELDVLSRGALSSRRRSSTDAAPSTTSPSP